jgi:hypothetical protein
MAISPDGSHVYFVAKGLLAGANAEGREPAEGGDNLYVYDVEEAKTRFIATLPGIAEDESLSWVSGIGVANISPEGRYLVFTSHAALTPDATREGPAQVYRYDATGEELTRISIGERGFDDNGNAGTGDAKIVRASIGFLTSIGPGVEDPTMSADGSRIFFESPIGLTPGALDDKATNNRGGLASNVYEWEEDGKGSCEEPSGCVYLISDGRDAGEGGGGEASAVELLGTDASGGNVFFTTADRLTPSDTDTQLDIYDARVGGGFGEPPMPKPCQGDVCKGAGTQAVAQPSPATPDFNGPGDEIPKPTRCKKGFVKRHGKCVKKHVKRQKSSRHHHRRRSAHGNRRAGR